MEYKTVTWMQASTTQPTDTRNTDYFADAVTKLLPELEKANAESRRLIDDGWKPEGPPAIRGSGFIHANAKGFYSQPVACDIYGQRFTRQRPVAIIPPVPPTLIPVVPSVPEPATLIPPAVNWNRLNARSRANLQTGIPNVLPRASNGIPQTGGGRKTRKPRRKH